MKRYIARRLAALLAVLLFVSAAIFGGLHLVPGDPAILTLGPRATPELVEKVHRELGLDQPLWKQYLNFIAGAVRGDLGRTYMRNRSVAGELARTFPVTLALSASAMALSVFVGVGLGVWTAARANSWIDNTVRVVLLTSSSVPVFWLGLMLIYGFSVSLQWFPSFGWGTARHLVLPAVTLATFPLALIGRLTRAAVVEVLRTDYITTARAKGLTEKTVVLRHALHNALVPVVTVIGLQFGILLAGAVLTETIFSVPGLGQLLIASILARDYPMIRGCVLLAAVAVAVMNLVVDLTYLFLDPRIRYQ